MNLLAQAAAGAEPRTWLDIVRHDVVPVLSAYVLFVLLLFAHHRRMKRERTPPPRKDLGSLARTELGGFLVFVAIILIFYEWLGGETLGFAARAVAQGAVLAFAIVLPAFLLMSWAARRWRGTRW